MSASCKTLFPTIAGSAAAASLTTTTFRRAVRVPIRATFLLATALLMGANAWGHHSFAAVYLEDQEVTIEGRLVQFLWRNPHTLVHVMVEQDDGSNVRYVVEWGSATQLGATGVSRETLRPGDYVVINGNPGRNVEDNRVRLLNFLRPSDGLTWGLRPDEVFD